MPLVVKFGAVFNDENEEILILPHEAYEFSVAQYIYEMIILAVPNKRIHPKVEDGTMQSAALDKLKELEIKEEKTVETTDPRWDKLKNLITEKRHKMAHPKRKISKTRRDKRRTHYKASAQQIATDPKLVRRTYTTERTGTKVNYITEVK
jgi:ribosomal protein L32